MANKYTAGASSGSAYVGIPENILTLHTNEVIYTALPIMRYDQFAVVRNDLQARRGDTISFNKYNNLTRGGQISEDSEIESQAMSKSSITISVTEYGNAVGLTSKFMTLSFMDEMQEASIQLGRDYAIVTDIMLRDALFSGTQTYYAGNKSEQKDVIASDTYSTSDVDEVVTTLATGNVLKYVDANGEYYASFIHPHQAKSLKNELTSVKQYAYPEMIFKGELGEYNGIRFIETANVPNGAASASDPGYDATLISGYEYDSGKNNQVDLYKTVIFGERAYGWAIALPVELREDPGQSNFGRKIRVAWYAIMGAGKIVNENIMVVVTA